MDDAKAIDAAKEQFGKVLKEQLQRIERIKVRSERMDYTKLDKIVVGMLGGDGIGPYIAEDAQRVLEVLLKDEIAKGKVDFRVIEGLTIENRAKHLMAIPDDVLEEIKKCHVTLKGPTTTPERGDEWPNIESCNVAMRKELDLYANIRPVRIPKEGIDWMFFRENTEDMYAVGSQGVDVTPDLAIDFKVITSPGSRRIIDTAFKYAKENGKTSVTVVTKANVIKTTDGKFLDMAREVAKNYPDISWEGWYIDIMTAKLLDPKRRKSFQVIVLPNLYGDILTDEAAEMQGGVGTAGSANVGDQYAMFEAIHGSAPRMVREGRAKYADPSSMIRAGAMLLDHIGYKDLGHRLSMALDICGQYERKLVMTGRDTGATGKDFGEYLLDTVNDPKVQSRWEGLVYA
ncbi:MAG: isocitrate/isopropylmalate dehydrogenase family protein [Chloroflexi bacterium]|nr:isocitrate/isopropylmalate dehydrogenase family protein [Chloroflexota bacterium]